MWLAYHYSHYVNNNKSLDDITKSNDDITPRWMHSVTSQSQYSKWHIHKYSPPTLTEFMPTGLGVIEPDIAVLWKIPVQFYVCDKSWYVRNQVNRPTWFGIEWGRGHFGFIGFCNLTCHVIIAIILLKIINHISFISLKYPPTFFI